jgi:hypothetical protein
MLGRAAAAVVTAAAAVAVSAGPALADGSTVTALAPGAALATTPVVITGSGLAGTTAVAFPGAADVTPSAVSDTEVDVTVPAGAHSGAIVLRTPSGDVTGPVFTVLPTATLTASAASVVYPATVVFTSALTTAGIAIPGQPGEIQIRPAGRSLWTDGPRGTTDSNGIAHFIVRPMSNAAYRVVFDQTLNYGVAQSATVSVAQHPVVTATWPSVAPILTVLHWHGSVRPAQSGLVALDQHYAGAWHQIKKTTLTATGHFTFALKLARKTTYVYRVRRLVDAHQAGNVSPTIHVLGVDRTLRSGLSGPDVTALQKRLRSLHYDVGGITGTFGFDTQHAVVAFEKVQRLTRDGVVGPSVWKALAAPKLPRLAHPLRGASAVEIDLTKQVLYYAVDGRITRILDASTGGGYYYTGSDGTTQRAITPTGHFSVKYKLDRWVTSKLGVLYRPAYFNYSGYAIHGEPLVPSYPASHGCVRITVPAMDRLYAMLTDGMSVWIYRS